MSAQRRRESYGGCWRPKCVPISRRRMGGGEVPINCRRSAGMVTLTKVGQPRRHCDELSTMDSGSGDTVRTNGTGRV
jgi:hypothetical protein